MAIAEIDGTRIVLTTEYREREMVKQIPGARWSSDEALWWCPLSWAACAQLRGVFGPALQVGVGLNEWVKAEKANRILPCLALRQAEDSPELGILTRLRPFQRAGVAFLATARHALLADEMGLGKTVQAIAALEVLGDGAYPALIVCPNSMKFTWQKEFEVWAPHRKTVVIDGTAVHRRKQIAQLQAGEAVVGIINYEALRGHTRLSGYGPMNLTDGEKEEKELNTIDFGSVVADEAHRVKDPHSKQTRALWWISKEAAVRFALTGTPIANSPEDAWTLMRFVSPLEFPAKTKFIERYGLEAYNIYGFKKTIGIKSEHKDELFSIIDPRFIRRLKSQVLTQLPEKQYATRFVEMAPKQKKVYDTMRKDMLALLDGGAIVAVSSLVRDGRLAQFASCYGELGDPAFEVRENGKRVGGPFPTRAEADLLRSGDQWVHDVTPLKLTDPSCKVDALEEIVAELGEQQAVVFAESRQLIELAAKRLVKEKVVCAQVTGAVPAHERAENVAAFQRGEIKVLLLTLGAGGEGLTLTAASTAIFLQRSWSAVKNAQAEDRIHRIGQEADRVEIIDVISAGTIEEHVHATRAVKAEMMEEFVRDETALREWLAKV